MTEYAYLMKPGGRLYAITDVLDLHKWHEEHLEAHSMFRRISEEELKKDECIPLIYSETEEGKKVERNQGSKYYCVFERI